MTAGYKHINAYIEIIIYLLKANDWKKTADIQNYLTKIGILAGKNPHSDRRLLSVYLNNLEYSGYIEPKYIDEEEYKHRGRISQEWHINKRVFRDIISMNEEEKFAFFTTFNFLPEKYSKTLPFFEILRNLLARLSFEFNETMKEKIESAFKYVPDFNEKFSKVDSEILNKIYKAIIEEKAIRIVYERKNNILKLFPMGVFVYNGLFYLKTIDINSEKYKLLKIDCIKSISFEDLNPDEEKILRIRSKIYADTAFKFDNELPFIFAFDIEKSNIGCSSLEKFRFIETQFHIEEVDNKNLRVYAIGFTGWRFAGRIIVPYILKFYKPDEKIIEIAKKYKKEIEKNYKDISFDIKENEKRYEEFRNTYLLVLQERQTAI